MTNKENRAPSAEPPDNDCDGMKFHLWQETEHGHDICVQCKRTRITPSAAPPAQAAPDADDSQTARDARAPMFVYAKGQDSTAPHASLIGFYGCTKYVRADVVEQQARELAAARAALDRIAYIGEGTDAEEMREIVRAALNAAKGAK